MYFRNNMELETKRARLDFDEEPMQGHEFKSTGSADNLVFDIIMHNAVKCPRLLRKCRLVCKAWNMSACSVLRIISAATVDENFPGKLISLLKIRRLRTEADFNLPSPFRKIHLVANTFSQPHFSYFIKTFPEDLIITGLTLKGEEDQLPKTKTNKFFKKLHKLLFAHANTLKSLRIYHGDFELPPEFGLEKIELKKLKELSIKFEQESENFIEKILRHSKLEFLSISFLEKTPNMLRTSKLFQKIPSLKLIINFCDYTYPISKFIHIPLPNLTALEISCESDANPANCVRVISQWSGSLESLSIESVNIRLRSYPVFPNLREITFKDCYMNVFDFEKFPRLKQVKFVEVTAGWEYLVPHPGVEKLIWIAGESAFDQFDVFGKARNPQQNFHTFLKLFGELFPNIKEFDCDIRGWDNIIITSTEVQIIQTAFSSLKDITLNGKEIVASTMEM